jgi:cation diffusion facilitator family transporter
VGATRSALARTRRVVVLSLVLQIIETAAFVAAAAVTNSSALVAQSFAAAANIVVQVFLVIGVHTSTRDADDTHPLGYGRDRYFWTLFAALAVLVSGFAVAFDEAIRNTAGSAPVSAATFGYAILAIGLVLDGFALRSAFRETRVRAKRFHHTVWQQIRSSTEPTTITVLISNSIEVVGGLLAVAALAITQATGSSVPDRVASGLIGVALVGAALALTQQNRSFLTGRGVLATRLGEMRALVEAQPGIRHVPDLFGIVVGPSTVVVDGEVVFEDELTVPEVEEIISRAEKSLEADFPEVHWVYLTPVAKRRVHTARRHEGRHVG